MADRTDIVERQKLVDEARIFAPMAAADINYGRWEDAAVFLLARCKKLDMALQSLTPGGSEYVGDPDRCVTRAKENLQTYRTLWQEAAASAERSIATITSLRSDLEACREALKVAALWMRPIGATIVNPSLQATYQREMAQVESILSKLEQITQAEKVNA